MTAWVYILTNGKNGTLYIGVTADLAQRIYDHRRGMGSEFTRKYRLHQLVYVEAHATMPLAITRERLKTWNRAWKVRLINKDNPDWEDLFDHVLTWQ
jgi:putative endonuclease